MAGDCRILFPTWILKLPGSEGTYKRSISKYHRTTFKCITVGMVLELSLTNFCETRYIYRQTEKKRGEFRAVLLILYQAFQLPDQEKYYAWKYLQYEWKRHFYKHWNRVVRIGENNVYVVQVNSQELIMIIEFISVDETQLPPFTLFWDKR